MTIPRGLFWLLYLIGILACFIAATTAAFILLASLPDWQVYGGAGLVSMAVFTGAALAARAK